MARDDEKTGTLLTIDKNKIIRETKEHTNKYSNTNILDSIFQNNTEIG